MPAETKRYKMIRLYTDGGARGNPGPAAIGIVVCDQNDDVVKSFGEYIGRATNNQAEYSALARGLEIAANYTRGRVVCCLDSELVVRQMNGQYRVKDLWIKKFAEVVERRIRDFEVVEFVHRPRMTGHLALADRMVNATLDDARKAPINDMLKASITKQVEIGPGHEHPEPVDPIAVTGGFLEYCIRQGWIVKSSSGRIVRYYITEEGKKELRKLGIEY